MKPACWIGPAHWHSLERGGARLIVSTAQQRWHGRADPPEQASQLVQQTGPRPPDEWLGVPATAAARAASVLHADTRLPYGRARPACGRPSRGPGPGVALDVELSAGPAALLAAGARLE